MQADIVGVRLERSNAGSAGALRVLGAGDDTGSGAGSARCAVASTARSASRRVSSTTSVAFDDLRGVDRVEPRDRGRNRGHRLRIAERRHGEYRGRPRNASLHDAARREVGIHALERGDELRDDVVVRPVEQRIARRHVLWQIDETAVSELAAVHDGCHVDYGAERHPLVGEVRDVERSERPIEDQRHADDAHVALRREPRSLVVREVDAEFRRHGGGDRHDDAVERSRLGSLELQQRSAGAAADCRDTRAQHRLNPEVVDSLLKDVEDARVSPGHVAALVPPYALLSCAVIPDDRRPDEGRRHVGIVVAELRAQQGAPDLFKRARSAHPREPTLSGDVLERQRVAEPARVHDRRTEAQFVDERQRFEGEELRDVRHRVEAAVGVEAGLGRRPLQLRFESQGLDEVEQAPIARNDDVIEAVPRKVADRERRR